MGPLLVPKATGSRSHCDQLDNHSRSCHRLAEILPSANGFYALLDFAWGPWSENKKRPRYCLPNRLRSVVSSSPRRAARTPVWCMLSIALAHCCEAHAADFSHTGPNYKGRSPKSWPWPLTHCCVSSGGTHGRMWWDGGTQRPLSNGWRHVTALNLFVMATALNC